MGVFTGLAKPAWGALTHIFGKVATGEMHHRAAAADGLVAREGEGVGLDRAVGFLRAHEPLAARRRGMEGMAMGWDGSRGVTAMGHDFISVSRVGAEFREARPVYVKLAKGRKSKGELLEEGLDALMKAMGGFGWTIGDRGMDSAEHICGIKAKGRKGVVRVNDMKRDVFGDGLGIKASLTPVPFRTAHLHAHRGDRCAEIRWKRGFVQYCANPGKKDAPVEDVGVLVVESRFDGKSV